MIPLPRVATHRRERIALGNGFDAFPMFSPDGKKLIFSSNRNNGGTHDTNIFICDWVN